MAKPQQKNTGKAVAKPQSTNVAVTDDDEGFGVVVADEVPEHIEQGANRGNENVTSADLVIPRLELIQGLSPAVKRGDPGFIAGAQAGDLNNSVTRQLYGAEVHVVPVYYQMMYLVWRDRKVAKDLGIPAEDVGFFGAFLDRRDADARAEQEGGEERAVFVVDTPTHLCLLMNPETMTADEIMLSMPKTKAKISRQWNSMIKLGGGDRFSRVYRISSVLQKNAQGDFYNYLIEPSGFPNKKLYNKAKELYEVLAAGDKRVVMDTSHMETREDSEDPNAEM